MTHGGRPPKLLCIVGARPNFVKMAPIMEALRARDEVEVRLVHTGQHYDRDLSDAFFRDLNLSAPHVKLGVGSASHAVQTAEIMSKFEPVLDRECPAGILVVGDVNSTIATALVAVKRGVKVAHVEAGLRSFDRGMPEEINRILTDQISDIHFVTEPDGVENLQREGIPASRIRLVGNVMIDALHRSLARAAPPSSTLSSHGGVPTSGFVVLTLHRPSNVDDPMRLRSLLVVLREVSRGLPIVFPIHPRTRGQIRAAGLEDLLQPPNFVELPPIGYLEMLGLLRDARMVLTDSGGIQEETTALGVPCLTLRENTERPITVSEGTNTIVGSDPGKIHAAWHQVLDTGGKRGRVPALWDGRSGERIAVEVGRWLEA